MKMKFVRDAIALLKKRIPEEYFLYALETGTIRSFTEKHESTRHIAEVLTGYRGRLFSVDNNKDSIDISMQICKDIDNVTWIFDDSISYLEDKVFEKVWYHFIFLDTKNDPEHILREFKLAEQLIDSRGIIMIDDAGLNEDGTKDNTDAKKGLLVYEYLKSKKIPFEIKFIGPNYGSQLLVDYKK